MLSPTSTQNFYTNLSLIVDFKEIFKLENYQELPEDWWVVVTDIKSSTKAIEQGRYRDINSLGGCTVAAILNVTKPTLIPYVFGGDGATFCIPPQFLSQVRTALRGCIKLAAESFDLDLRAALLPYEAIKPNADLLVACYAKSDNLKQAIFIGGGLNEAERQIKLASQWHLNQNDGEAKVDLTGFECRWNRIASPQEITVSLLVEALNSSVNQQLTLYQELMQKIEQCFGVDEQHQPLSLEGLELMFGKSYLAAESKAKTFFKGNSFLLNLWNIRLQNLIGTLLMKLKVTLGKVKWATTKKILY